MSASLYSYSSTVPPSYERNSVMVSHDPAHLISAFDEADESDGTRSTMHKSLSQELAGPEDVTMSSSLNVYIDPMNGSDHGNGTKQDPFQSAEGALWKRGLEVSLWIKRRYTNTDRKFDPTTLPFGAIPVRVTEHSTIYWIPIEAASAREQIAREMGLTQDKVKEKKLFGLFKKKSRSKSIA